MAYYDTQTAVRGSAPQMDIGALLNAGKSISGSLGSIREKELVNAKMAEEQRRYDEDRAWKLEDRERVAKERQASDLFNQELLKGKQIHGGILNTDDLISESNKYAFTPEELVKYDTYKGDESAARKAGDTALADKMAWQTRVSDFASSGNDKLKESRVQMLERVLGNVSSKGLPIPAELVAGMEQARLSEETVNKEARRDIDEKISKLTESLNKDQKWAIGSLGTSQYTDDDGVTHNIGDSTGSSSSEVKANNTNVGQGNKLLMSAVDGLKLTDKDAELDATAKALELTNVLKERGIPFDDAAAIVANGLYSKEQNPIISYIGLGKKGPALDQEAIDLYANNALKQYQQTASGTTGNSTDRVRGPSEKALAAVDYYNTQASNVSSQLAKLNKEKALLEGNAEDRQSAALSRLLQSKGILEAPEESLSEHLLGKGKSDGAGKVTSFPGEGKTKADRNNNPGNLTGDDKWQGMVGKDGRFAQFQSYEMGSRALAKNLINGAVGNTVEDYMNKYAPKSENDTKSYINHVTKALGKESGSVITNADVLPLMKVIAKHEGGRVDEAKLEAGYKLATMLNGEGFKDTTGDVKDLFSKVDTPKINTDSSVFAPTSQELINSDDRLLQLKEEATNYIKGSPEYNKVQTEYNNRLKDLSDRGAGGDLAAYMTRHKSGPLAEAINKEITGLLKSGAKIPEKVVDFVKEGKGSIVDFQRILMEDANKGKDYIKILMDRLNRPGLEGKTVTIPNRPDWYKQ